MKILYKIDDFPNPGDRDVYRGIQEINKDNYQEAQKYFEKGSNYDNEYASLFNALLYYTGFGFAKRDPSKSMNLFKKIALEWNNPVAQYLIGAMYKEGDNGVSRHKKHAIKWLSLAAENNWTDAMVLLGLGYRDGTLFEKDEQKACSWFQKVAQKDDNETEPIDDGIIYLFGNKEFELHLDQQEIDVVKETVDQAVFPPAEYLESLPTFGPTDCQLIYTCIWSILTNKKTRGIIPSQILLGNMYSPGSDDIFPKDGPKSTYYWKKAAKNGNREACILLSLAYDHGKNGVQDRVEALKWYKQTIEVHNDMDAAYCIGVIFYKGEGVTRNCKLALDYFRLKVQDSDHGPSHFLMGDIYEKGKDGVLQDYKLARHHFKKAFDCGNADGAVTLSRFYMEGLGVRKDPEKAKEWMSRAISMEPALKLVMGLFLNTLFLANKK